jgi:hypothetical protein
VSQFDVTRTVDRWVISRKGAKKEKTRGAKKIARVGFAPCVLQFLAALRET